MEFDYPHHCKYITKIGTFYYCNYHNGMTQFKNL